MANAKYNQQPTADCLHTIGTDGQSSITQFLNTNEIISFSQVSRLCYEILNRHQSYYQLPFPSFHRTEFNLLKYDHWRQSREPLILTPHQLLDYSHSRVMSHATDIELHVGQCELYAQSSSISRRLLSFLSPSNSRTQQSQQLNELRAAVERFHHVRAFKIVFRPQQEVFHRCFIPRTDTICLNSSMTTSLVLVRLCLELWGHSLLSFECERHTSYHCVIPENLLTPYMHHLTSIQHVGINLLREVKSDELIRMVSKLRFPSDEVGLIVHNGEDIGSRSRQKQPPASTALPCTIAASSATNAAHVLWLNSSSQNVFGYLEETCQLLQPYPYELFPGYSRPTIPFLRTQLRNLSITHSIFKNDSAAEITVKQFTVDDTPRQAGDPDPTIHESSLSIPTAFLLSLHITTNHQCKPLGMTLGEGERHYLSPLRHQLTKLTLSTNHPKKAPVVTGELVQPSWLIPTDLFQPSVVDDHVWTRLESLELLFKEWDQLSSDECSPIDGETWIALGGMLPHVHTLNLSIRLLPSADSSIGLLKQIKHLTLTAWNPTQLNHQQLSHYIHRVVCDLPQLESIYLNINQPHLQNTNHLSSICEYLAPLLLASNNLSLIQFHVFIFESDDDSERIKLLKESLVLLYYAFWQLLQPSLSMPYQSVTFDQLLYPLLPHNSRHAYQNSRVLKRHYELFEWAESDFFWGSDSARVRQWLQTRMSGWNSWRTRLSSSVHKARQVEQLKLIQRRELIVQQFQQDLQLHASRLVQDANTTLPMPAAQSFIAPSSASSTSSPSTATASSSRSNLTLSSSFQPRSIQPRSCTIQLLYEYKEEMFRPPWIVATPNGPP